MDGGGGYTPKEAVPSDVGKLAGIPDAQEIGRQARRLFGSETDAILHSSHDHPHIDYQQNLTPPERIGAAVLGPEMNLGGGYTPKEAAGPYASITGIPEAARIGHERRSSIEEVYSGGAGLHHGGHGGGALGGGLGDTQEEADRAWRTSLRNPVADTLYTQGAVTSGTGEATAGAELRGDAGGGSKGRGGIDEPTRYERNAPSMTPAGEPPAGKAIGPAQQAESAGFPLHPHAQHYGRAAPAGTPSQPGDAATRASQVQGAAGAKPPQGEMPSGKVRGPAQQAETPGFMGQHGA